MCNVDQHASMIGPPLRPLIRFQLNVASCPAELLAQPKCTGNQKMTEQKKPKRIRQKVIQVVVTEAEKKEN